MLRHFNSVTYKMKLIILGKENSLKKCQLLEDNSQLGLKNSEIRFLSMLNCKIDTLYARAEDEKSKIKE